MPKLGYDNISKLSNYVKRNMKLSVCCDMQMAVVQVNVLCIVSSTQTPACLELNLANYDEVNCVKCNVLKKRIHFKFYTF